MKFHSHRDQKGSSCNKDRSGAVGRLAWLVWSSGHAGKAGHCVGTKNDSTVAYKLELDDVSQVTWAGTARSTAGLKANSSP